MNYHRRGYTISCNFLTDKITRITCKPNICCKSSTERKKNYLKLDAEGKSAIMRFSNIDIQPNLRDFHPFGCPVFVLDARLQSGGSKIPKWDPRARVGIYLGHSPCHAGNVAFVPSR